MNSSARMLMNNYLEDINNRIHSKRMCIIHRWTSPKRINGGLSKNGEWINNHIPCFCVNFITYPSPEINTGLSFQRAHIAFEPAKCTQQFKLQKHAQHHFGTPNKHWDCNLISCFVAEESRNNGTVMEIVHCPRRYRCRRPMTHAICVIVT